MTFEKQHFPPENLVGEISSDVSSTKMFYPLEEATKLVQNYYPNIDLLSYANHMSNSGKINFLVAVPKNIDVIRVDNRINYTVPFWAEAPDMFVVGQWECHRVQNNERVEQTDFKIGYSFSQVHPKEMHPFDNVHPPQLEHAKAFWVWRTVYKNTNQTFKIDIAHDRLFVLHSDIIKHFPLIDQQANLDSKHQTVSSLVAKENAHSVSAAKTDAAPDNPQTETVTIKETKEEKGNRLLKRKAELLSQGVRNFLVVMAKEEMLSVPRIKQLIAAAEKKTLSSSDKKPSLQPKTPGDWPFPTTSQKSKKSR